MAPPAADAQERDEVGNIFNPAAAPIRTAQKKKKNQWCFLVKINWENKQTNKKAGNKIYSYWCFISASHKRVLSCCVSHRKGCCRQSKVLWLCFRLRKQSVRSCGDFAHGVRSTGLSFVRTSPYYQYFPAASERQQSQPKLPRSTPSLYGRFFFIIIFLKKNYRSRCMGLPRTKEGWEQRSTSRTQCLSVIFPRREQLHAPGSNHTLITEMYPTEILHPKTHPFSPKVIHKRHRDEHKEANLDSTSVAILLPSPQYLPLVYLLFLTWEKCCKTTGRYMWADALCWVFSFGFSSPLQFPDLPFSASKSLRLCWASPHLAEACAQLEKVLRTTKQFKRNKGNKRNKGWYSSSDDRKL